jgi:two-component system CheB/CheR fusion protein
VPLSSPLLSAVFERAGVGLCLVGPSGAVIRANAEWLRATGFSVGDVTGRDLASLFPDTAPSIRSLHERARGGETLVLPRHVQRVQGRETWWEGTISPVPMPDGVGTLVTARDVTAEVHEAEALREADRRKDEFLAVLSHELRNPLAPVRNACSVLERAPPGSEAAERARAVIARQVDHLARLVDDLLDVTRISRGKIRLQRRPTDVAEVARRCAEDHRPLFAARRIALEVALPDGPLWVDGDPVRLAQVVGNLLQNAWKFTAPGGNVSLRTAREGDRAVLRVKDDGAGIGPELIGMLFQPFTQAERTLERSRGGLGLGLALVKGVVELHGGSVAAHSDGEGKGTEIVVTLRAIPAPAAAQERPVRRAAGRRRVLLVEDNADAASSLRDLLALRGHEVHVAADGPAGVEAALRLRPDLVLCDVGLPGMSGYEVARRLRRDPALDGTTLVAVTGYATAEDAARALGAGFHHHLTKPMDLEAVVRLLEGSGAAEEEERADALH